MLKWCGSGGVVKSDYSVSSLSEKESRERESLTTSLLVTNFFLFFKFLPNF